MIHVIRSAGSYGALNTFHLLLGAFPEHLAGGVSLNNSGIEVYGGREAQLSRAREIA